jgi:hypothetical protein
VLTVFMQTIHQLLHAVSGVAVCGSRKPSRTWSGGSCNSDSRREGLLTWPLLSHIPSYPTAALPDISPPSHLVFQPILHPSPLSCTAAVPSVPNVPNVEVPISGARDRL